MVRTKFDTFFENEDSGDREQLERCWNAAQDAMFNFIHRSLTFSQLAEANQERQRTTPAFKECITWTPSDWMLAITGEIGEAANWMKKKKRGDEGIMISDIVKELADVIIYTDILIQFYHYDTGMVIASKFNEVSDRVGSSVKLLLSGSHEA